MKILTLVLVIWLEGAYTQTTSKPSDQKMCICLEPFPSFGKTFNKAVHMASANDDSKRIFVVGLTGTVWIVYNGKILNTPFVDITSDVDQSKKETGLQTIAFHPDFKQNGKIYLFYTAKVTAEENAVKTIRLVVEEFKVKANDSNAIDTASRRPLLKLNAQDVFHFGGKIWFDAKGFMNIAVGDTKLIPEKLQSQDMSSMIGKILRIDVDNPDPDHGKPYSIPNDNPFVNVTGVLPEVYAWGLRNPWQCSVDEGDGNGMPNISYTDPIFSYPHGAHGKSVIGGFVYRGFLNPGLQGLYIYADYGYNKGLFALKEDVKTGKWNDISLPFCGNCEKPLRGKYAITYPISFGQDEKGEAYLIGTRNLIGFSGNWKAYIYKVVLGYKNKAS